VEVTGAGFMGRENGSNGTHSYLVHFPIGVWGSLEELSEHRGASFKTIIVDAVKEFIARTNEAELHMCREKHRAALEDIDRKLEEIENARRQQQDHEDVVADEVVAIIEADADAWWNDNAPSIGRTLTEDNWLSKCQVRLDVLQDTLRSKCNVKVDRERLVEAYREIGIRCGIKTGAKK